MAGEKGSASMEIGRDIQPDSLEFWDKMERVSAMVAAYNAEQEFFLNELRNDMTSMNMGVFMRYTKFCSDYDWKDAETPPRRSESGVSLALMLSPRSEAAASLPEMGVGGVGRFSLPSRTPKPKEHRSSEGHTPRDHHISLDGASSVSGFFVPPATPSPRAPSNPSHLGRLCEVMGAQNKQRQVLSMGLTKWNEKTDDTLKAKRNVDGIKQTHTEMSKKFTRKLKKQLQLKSTLPPETLQYKDEAFLQLKHHLEMNRFDLWSSQQHFVKGRRLRTVAPLSAGLRAYYEFFRKGWEIMEPLLDEIEELETFVVEEERMVEEDRKIWDKHRKAFEEQAIEKLMKEQEGAKAGAASSAIRDFAFGSDGPAELPKEKSGYLYLRNPVGQAVWVAIKDGSLSISQGRQPSKTFPLFLVSVKENHEHKLRFVIQVSTPGQDPMLLQAGCYTEMNEWIKCIQAAISDALNQQHGHDGGANDKKDMPQRKQLEEFWQTEGNNVCADCGREEPDWVSLNLGIFICMGCSGFHRNLGVHISQVRSMTLDQIDPISTQYLKEIGNTCANKIFEYTLLATPAVREAEKPPLTAPRTALESFIRKKYIKKGFVAPLPDNLSDTGLTEMLFTQVKESNAVGVLRTLAWGASINARGSGGVTPLMQAVVTNNKLVASQLVLSGADFHLCDDRKWNVLHYVTLTKQREMAELLLQRGARELLLLENNDGLTPAQLAKGDKPKPKVHPMPSTRTTTLVGSDAEDEDKEDSEGAQGEEDPSEPPGSPTEPPEPGPQQEEDEPPPPPPENTEIDEEGRARNVTAPPPPPPRTTTKFPMLASLADGEDGEDGEEAAVVAVAPLPPVGSLTELLVAAEEKEKARLQVRLDQDLQATLDDSSDDEEGVATGSKLQVPKGGSSMMDRTKESKFLAKTLKGMNKGSKKFGKMFSSKKKAKDDTTPT